MVLGTSLGLDVGGWLLGFIVVGFERVGACDGLAVVGCIDGGIAGLLVVGLPVGSLAVGKYDGLCVGSPLVGKYVSGDKLGEVFCSSLDGMSFDASL